MKKLVCILFVILLVTAVGCGKIDNRNGVSSEKNIRTYIDNSLYGGDGDEIPELSAYYSNKLINRKQISTTGEFVENDVELTKIIQVGSDNLNGTYNSSHKIAGITYLTYTEETQYCSKTVDIDKQNGILYCYLCSFSQAYFTPERNAQRQYSLDECKDLAIEYLNVVCPKRDDMTLELKSYYCNDPAISPKRIDGFHYITYTFEFVWRYEDVIINELKMRINMFGELCSILTESQDEAQLFLGMGKLDMDKYHALIEAELKKIKSSAGIDFETEMIEARLGCDDYSDINEYLPYIYTRFNIKTEQSSAVLIIEIPTELLQ